MKRFDRFYYLAEQQQRCKDLFKSSCTPPSFKKSAIQFTEDKKSFHHNAASSKISLVKSSRCTIDSFFNGISNDSSIDRNSDYAWSSETSKVSESKSTFSGSLMMDHGIVGSSNEKTFLNKGAPVRAFHNKVPQQIIVSPHNRRKLTTFTGAMQKKNNGENKEMTLDELIQKNDKPLTEEEVLKEAENMINRLQTHPLEPIFKPKNVAVVGASEKEGSVGRTIMWNLMSSPFGGTIYPINNKRKNVMGIKAYGSVLDLYECEKEQIDLVVICIPSKLVPEVMRQCGKIGVRGAIIISAGFGEGGELETKAIGEDVKQIALKHNIKFIGPNCLGVMMPWIGLNATFASGIAKKGNIALISQSGALATAILDYSFHENIGFSAFLSIGSMMNVQWGDLIEYFGKDTQTEAIIIYMESIGDARSFISAARQVAITKPIVLIKVGKTEEGGQAAASHTGTITGSDDILDVAFKRCGILRVDKIDQLFHMSQTLAKQPRPTGNRLTIVTNAGGPGVLSVDELIEGGGKLAQISDPLMKELNTHLPPYWSKNNPIDVLGDAGADRYTNTLKSIANTDAKSSTDGILIILTPQAMTDSTGTAEELISWMNNQSPESLSSSKLNNSKVVQKARSIGIPVLASWMGGPIVEKGREILTKNGIPTFGSPDNAVNVFNLMCQYSSNINSLYEVPDMQLMQNEVSNANRIKAREFIEKIRESEDRTLLTEYESKKLLALYGFPVTDIEIANSEDEAAQYASKMSYPVVLKVNSDKISHKTDVGGVRLNIQNEEHLRREFSEMKESIAKKTGVTDFKITVQPMVDITSSFGYEIIFGSKTDQQIGPCVVFGHGGTYVEVHKDTSIGIPPLTANLSSKMIQRTNIYKMMNGYRGRPRVNIERVEQLLMRFSQLVTDLNNYVQEIDINPLYVTDKNIVALDARVVVYPKNTNKADIPRLAIRPYPFEYVSNVTIENSSESFIQVRPIKPDDAKKMGLFFNKVLNVKDSVIDLEEPSVSKYLNETQKAIIRMSISDYDKEMTLIATNSEGEVVGMCSYERNQMDKYVADISMIVLPKYQKKGLGKQMLNELVAVAEKEGIETLRAEYKHTGKSMLRLCNELGFNSLIYEKEVTSYLKLNEEPKVEQEQLLKQ